MKVADHIFENDTLQTGLNSALGVTFDDETTFSLSANTRIVVDKFVYEEGASGNAASFHVATGTAAFVASLVAKTGDMKVSTDNATLGIRGTTGVVEVPAAGGANAPTIKLYPDTDGHVGRIEVFDRQGGRLGALTQGASAFSLRLGANGRISAVPYQIPPQEAARDRGVLQRLNTSHAVGRQIAVQRRQIRTLNRQRQNNQRPGNQQPNSLRQNNQRPNNQQPNNLRQNNQRPGGPQIPCRGPGGQQPFNRLQRGPAGPRPRGPGNKSGASSHAELGSRFRQAIQPTTIDSVATIRGGTPCPYSPWRMTVASAANITAQPSAEPHSRVHACASRTAVVSSRDPVTKWNQCGYPHRRYSS